jgi:hypothetical protein
VTGARSFEIALDGHELNSLLSGLRLFVDVTPRAPRVAPATLAVALAARLQPSKGGDPAIVLTEPLRPVNVGGELVYRAHVDTVSPRPLRVESGGAALAVKPATPSGWAVDLGFTALEAEAASRATARFVLVGSPVQAARAEVRLVVGEAELFRGDAEARFPLEEDCAPALQTCIDRLPPGETDYGSCGDYRAISRCHLPGRPPRLSLLESEEVEPILDAAYAVRTLTGQRLYANVYVVEGWTAAPPRLADVQAAWQAALGVTAMPAPGALPLTAIRQELAAWQATAVGARAEALYGPEGAQGARLQGPGGRPTYVLLYFPDMGRLVVLESLKG